MAPSRPGRDGGVIAVVATPFDAGGAVDHEALGREVDYLVGVGVEGVAMGFGSESIFLTDRERDDAVATIVSAVAGRCPIVAPVVVTSAAAARDRAVACASIGAEGLMVTPPPGSADAVLEFFRALDAVSACWIMIQDAPALTGVAMSDTLLTEVCQLPRIVAIKVETPDAYVRIARLRPQLPPELPLLGGNGGVQLMSELRAGSDGTMPGAGNAAAIVRVVRAFREGRERDAEADFAALQPLLVLAAATPETYLFVQKELLRRDGVIDRPTMRSATIPAESALRKELAYLLGPADERSPSPRSETGG